MIDARVPAAPPWARFRSEPLADVVSRLFEEFALQRVDDDLDVLLREPLETLLLELAKRLASGPRSEAELGAFADGSARLRPTTGSDARDRERRALDDLLVPRDGPAVQSCFRLGLPAHHRSQARPWRPAAASGNVVEPNLRPCAPHADRRLGRKAAWGAGCVKTRLLMLAANCSVAA